MNTVCSRPYLSSKARESYWTLWIFGGSILGSCPVVNWGPQLEPTMYKAEMGESFNYKPTKLSCSLQQYLQDSGIYQLFLQYRRKDELPLQCIGVYKLSKLCRVMSMSMSCRGIYLLSMMFRGVYMLTLPVAALVSPVEELTMPMETMEELTKPREEPPMAREVFTMPSEELTIPMEEEGISSLSDLK